MAPPSGSASGDAFAKLKLKADAFIFAWRFGWGTADGERWSKNDYCAMPLGSAVPTFSGSAALLCHFACREICDAALPSVASGPLTEFRQLLPPGCVRRVRGSEIVMDALAADAAADLDAPWLFPRPPGLGSSPAPGHRAPDCMLGRASGPNC